jgi:hypothetical protein
MGYQKQNFVSGQVLNSAHLNHIENGIVEVESSVSTSIADKVTKEDLKNIIDPTLSLSGKAADAKATGDAIRGVKDDLATEVTRAKAAEQANAEGTAAEASRAKAEEQRLDTAIAAEKTRAEQAEQALDMRTAALESCGFVVVDGKICVKYIKR